MQSDVIIRSAVPDDVPQVLELMKLSLGEGKIPREPEYWSWKHLKNPFGPSPSLLAFSGEQLVAMRVFMRWRWRAGRDVRAVRAVDTATHPEWQGKGLFTRLTRLLLEQMRGEAVDFVYNTPNAKSRPGYLKMGWVSVGRTSLWLRPLAHRKVGRVRPASSAQKRPEVARPVAELLRDARLARFLSALPESGSRLSTAIDPEYLRWRYSAIPGFTYAAEWSFDGEDGAVIVSRRKQGRFDELRLSEILVGQGAGSVRLGRELLHNLLRHSDADYASAMATAGTQAQRVLLGCGFIPAPRTGPIMTVHPLALASGEPDPRRRSAWQLSIGDLELF